MGCRIRARPPLSGPRGSRVRRIAADERALSDTHGELLMVAVTIILAALVLLMLLAMIPSWSWAEPPEPPIIITGVLHTSKETGALTWASRVILLNNGSTVYENDCLRAVFYQNGQKIRTVQTLNGHLIIASHHNGVRYLKGPGCRTPYWNPGEEMEVDLADRTLQPGAKVTVAIVDKRTGKVISRHTVRA
ncbi:type IV pilin [Methanoculleus sp. 7T]|uniref:type IV pilin n=1 Tax=Methanoculleus sp. 7T TaxID=2937282 RepID=UPI0020BE584A|nr:type IV pilin [Methanoculleus sp. 7T]MCK8517631.1 type IV pilin [Methanoculleus sp. 7T]